MRSTTTACARGGVVLAEGRSLEGGSLEGGSFEGRSLEGESLEGGSLEGGSLEGGSLACACGDAISEGASSSLFFSSRLRLASPALQHCCCALARESPCDGAADAAGSPKRGNSDLSIFFFFCALNAEFFFFGLLQGANSSAAGGGGNTSSPWASGEGNTPWLSEERPPRLGGERRPRLGGERPPRLGGERPPRLGWERPPPCFIPKAPGDGPPSTGCENI